jgi:hypothetical protein
VLVLAVFLIEEFENLEEVSVKDVDFFLLR